MNISLHQPTAFPALALTVLLAAGIGGSALLARDIIVPGHTDDYAIAEASPPVVVSTGGASLRIGANTNFDLPSGRNTVILFELPALQPDESVLAAQITVTVAGKAGTPTFNADLWALGFFSNALPVTPYFEADSGDPQAIKFHDNLLTPAAAAGTSAFTTNNAALGGYIQSFYDTRPGSNGGGFAFFRLNPDADAGTGNVGLSIASADNDAATARPRLTLTTSLLTPAPDTTNFIFIVTDDQRWDALGVVQREMGLRARFPWFQTPNMDRLAAEGVRFRNAFVVNALCSPSRACFLTSRYNHHNGIVNNSTPFDTNNVTHASLLRQHGWITGYTGKWHMDSQTVRPGFDFYASYTAHGSYSNATFLVNGTSTHTLGWVDDVCTDYALEFIRTNQNRSFLLVVGYKSPHGPHTPPTRLKDLYTNATVNPAPNASFPPPFGAGSGGLSLATLRDYFRTLAGVDENLGRILATLDILNLASNTVVVYAGDNGYYLGEHTLGDKRSAYEESIRIPLLLRYPPRAAPGQVVDEMVLNLDLAPTFLDLAGVAVPSEMLGRSWRPLLDGAPLPWRQSFFYEYFREASFSTPHVVALRTTNRKLVVYPDHDEWTELFDLAADPYETNNLAFDPVWADTRSLLTGQLAGQMQVLGYFSVPTAPVRAGDTFQFELSGGIGPVYRIESTESLSQWQTLGLVTNRTGRVSVTDSNATSPHRFYRALWSGN